MMTFLVENTACATKTETLLSDILLYNLFSIEKKNKIQECFKGTESIFRLIIKNLV